MLGIFEDEQRKSGAFGRGPFGVGSKLPAILSKMLESQEDFLALFSSYQTILTSTLLNVLNLNRPYTKTPQCRLVFYG